MWREKNIYFTEPDIYFTKFMFILKNINLELKSALRTKYLFCRTLLYTIDALGATIAIFTILFTLLILLTLLIIGAIWNKAKHY